MSNCSSLDEVIPQLDVLFALLNLLVGVSSILMNFLVFAVYIRLNWKHPTYFLFINITFHDAMSGFTGIYMGVFLFYNRPESLAAGVNELCVFNGLLWSLTAFTTPTLLCIASAFRFMAIYMPYSYKDMVTLRNASGGVIAGWLVGLLSTLIPIFSGINYEYSSTSSVCDTVKLDTVNRAAMVIFILIPLLLPLCILMLCNAAVLLHLCKCTAAHSGHRPKSSDIQLHEQPLTGPPLHGNHGNHGNSKVPQFGSICEWKHKVARKDYHTATTVVLMTLNYFICYGLWIVYFIHRIFKPTAGSNCTSLINDQSGEIYIDATIKLMACMNSALNGIVHIARGSQIRTQVARLVAMVTSSYGSENANHHGVATSLNTQMSNNPSKSRS